MSEPLETHAQVEPDASDRSFLDEWIGEVGEDGVAAWVEATMRGQADGSLPSFTDAAGILDDWATRYPRR